MTIISNFLESGLIKTSDMRQFIESGSAYFDDFKISTGNFYGHGYNDIIDDRKPQDHIDKYPEIIVCEYCGRKYPYWFLDEHKICECWSCGGFLNFIRRK